MKLHFLCRREPGESKWKLLAELGVLIGAFPWLFLFPAPIFNFSLLVSVAQFIFGGGKKPLQKKKPEVITFSVCLCLPLVMMMISLSCNTIIYSPAAFSNCVNEMIHVHMLLFDLKKPACSLVSEGAVYIQMVHPERCRHERRGQASVQKCTGPFTLRWRRWEELREWIKLFAWQRLHSRPVFCHSF